MRKIRMFNLVSLDGFFAGPDGSIDWHVVDGEFDRFAVEQTKTPGAIIFGRVTYQLFESFWPPAEDDPATSADNLKIAKWINGAEKHVFSRSLPSITLTPRWRNVTLHREVVPGEIQRLKQGTGPDLVIFGSGTIVRALAGLGLIDEYGLMINPVVLGAGRSLFGGVAKRMKLKLTGTRQFVSGNILLNYQP